MSLVNFNELDQYANKYKSARTNLEENAKKIQLTIENQTKKETEEVQAAIDRLNAKVKDILETDEVKAIETEIKNSQQQIDNSLKYAYGLFMKIKKIIEHKIECVEKRKEYEQKLIDRIIERFLSPEEIEMFKNMIKYGNIMVVPNRHSNNMIGL